ncbi:DUF4268 domain-containing protein [Pelagicoccus sp. SDUM812005]|uniref:DUF4268 domain-containing protein n=1 Tax=Pelagicoccus sp. SDUM812005 TaxID=3041257 RepID=UPI00280E7B07|nr:DUF4268 domain-containing protein [Pelagicoccus sp. SDUM812005]MDQ8179652.1 DUF4268 domain-containing protein [Pelagicoccus sp. SDUM812005]
MYRIDSHSNNIVQLEEKRFGELGFTERGHLQEWISKCPSSLGEELLIIQKEFDGFDETRERLDLLALDKNGKIVVIENKLDDSGRDVVWQALKYASYCSSLKTSQVIDIFQSYLNKYQGFGDAKELICEFLDTEDLSDVTLNPGSDQRLILVSAKFRREVTSTVLWLLQKGVSVQCFKATPYQHGDQLYLKLEQIIPTPESADFMIGISEKEKEQQTTERVKANRHILRLDFWRVMLDEFEKQGIPRFGNVNPTKDHWLNVGSGVANVTLGVIFSKTEARVQVNLTRASQEENKAVFDFLSSKRESIEEDFGACLEWHRMDEAKSSRIIYRNPFDGYNRDSWPEMILWISEHIQLLGKAITPHLQTAKQRLRS